MGLPHELHHEENLSLKNRIRIKQGARDKNFRSDSIT